MTLAELLAACYADGRYRDPPEAAVTTRITRWLNEGVRAVLAEPGLSRLLDSDDPFALTSVANQARYVVPEAVAEIRAITDQTNRAPLGVMTMGAYRRRAPLPSATTGTPTHLVPIGRVAVASQPSAAAELFVKSTSASDTSAVRLSGIRTGGYLGTTTGTLTGTTAVALSAMTDLVTVTDWSMGAPAVGTVSLHEGSGTGTTLAQISVGHTRPRYYGFDLWPTPAAAIDYVIDYRRLVPDLVSPSDEPPWSPDHHPLLVAYALAREFEYTSDPRASLAGARYVKGLSRLKYATQTLASELPVAGRVGRLGRSRLGGWYPADLERA